VTYRVYIRWSDNRVSDKTTTPAPHLAEQAFRDLLHRQDLRGQKAAVVLSLNNRQLEYVRLDREVDEIMPVRLFHDESQD
jgi:hypothetical protein